MNKWDERYDTLEYVYGKEPNQFLASVANKIPKGRVLCLGEGEGRNAVYLAKMDYDVTAVDASKVGLEKAHILAEEYSASINTIVSDLEEYQIAKDSWHGIVSIFCHIPKLFRSRLHQDCVNGLKTGGIFIMEAYSPNQLKYCTGGPKVPELLYDLKEIKSELKDLHFEIAREIVREVYEGTLHKGLGSVVQIMAVKK